MAENGRSRNERALAAAEAEIKKLKSERANLRRQLTNSKKKIERLEVRQAETQTALKEAQAKIDELSQLAERLAREVTEPEGEAADQITALLAENRRMAGIVETAAKDLALFREAAEKIDDAVQQARSETETKVKAEFDVVLAKKEKESTALRKEVADLSRQLRQQGKVVSVPPERVAELINGLVGRLDGGIPNMNLRQGEIKLKVGFGGTGDTAGFIVPTPDSPAEVRENLNEITMRFDRAASLSSQED